MEPELHRLYISIANEKQWYEIMRECRSWFGKNWRSQGRVKRKLAENQHHGNNKPSVKVWFDVPDLRFATWVSVKYSLQVAGEAKHNAGK